MTETTAQPSPTEICSALWSSAPSSRLRAALAAGTRPDQSFPSVLVERCGIEPDFFVRDMLTWALTRHGRTITVPPLLRELRSATAQARSQALHTLSKIGDPTAWTAITPDLLHDSDDEVARAAWRTAVGLVPPGGEADLAESLAAELGRGDRDVQRSLSRAFAVLGAAARPAIDLAVASENTAVSTHAAATLTIIADPEASFDAAMAEAERTLTVSDGPAAGDVGC